MKKTKKRQWPGFYMIEAILSMFLVTAGMLVTMLLISGTLKNSFYDRDQSAAVFLAQEGTELVRNLRDNNFATHASSASGGAFASPFPGSDNSQCRIDSTASSFSCSIANYNLGLNANKYYVHSGGTATKFKRRIGIKYSTAGGSGDSNNYATITSVVTWNGSTPPDPNLSGISSNCQATEACVFSQVNLTRWAQ